MKLSGLIQQLQKPKAAFSLCSAGTSSNPIHSTYKATDLSHFWYPRQNNMPLTKVALPRKAWHSRVFFPFVASKTLDS